MKKFRDIFLLLAALFAGCGNTSMIPHGLPDAEDAVNSANGAWVIVIDSSGRHEGELIAIDRDTLHLITGTLESYPCREIMEARVYVSSYPITPDNVYAYTALGALSTVSHGVGLILSFPVWLLSGPVAGSATARDADAGDLSFPASGWRELRNYARFPQGMPDGLDRTRLRMAVLISSRKEN